MFQEPVRTGIDLQKYIEEEIENAKRTSDSQQQSVVTNNNAQRKSFSQSSYKEPKYFDLPIKIEENGEGFTPPSEIR